MKPAPFRYSAPLTVDEAVELVAREGDAATPLAGGQSLVPMMNLRLVQPQHVVDLNRADGLAGVEAGDGAVRIGAMTRYRAVERSAAVAEAVPLLARAVPHVATVVIRTRGTIGGSIAHADPAAELPTALVAADARLVLRGAASEREVDAEDFFVGPYETARRPDELLVACRVPRAAATERCAFGEVARQVGDFALVMAAVRLTIDAGRCTDARVVVGAAAGAPVRCRAAEQSLKGSSVPAEAQREAAARAAGEVAPRSDIHGSGSYRRRLVEVQVRRCIEQAIANGGAERE